MTTDLRDFGDRRHVVVFTDDQETRKKLKKLAGFAWESLYYHGNKLVGVDLAFEFEPGKRAAIKRRLKRMIVKAREL